MNEFDSYKNDFGFEIGSGFSGNSDYMKALDEKKRRALMEEQYNFLQIQKLEILAQQKFVSCIRRKSLLNKNTAKSNVKGPISINGF
ncbi:hypothetical protein [Phocaeicola coprophilus]|uniref:hypothetical protein n=1 Tax=Phocaeicola coprophilus TaxID=387090 RepID=UPI0022E559DF|nr:hypothetical protein [Phocaeicola coprophilus]